MSKQILLIIAIALIGSNAGFGQKIYLSPEGNDNNPGSADKPLATLTAARDKARELRKNGNVSQPVEIIPMAGEYFMFQPLLLTVDDSGTSDFPLTFKAGEGAKAIFRGGVKLTGAEMVSPGLWRIFVPQ